MMQFDFRKRLYVIAALLVLIVTAANIHAYWYVYLTTDSDLTYHVATAQSFVRNGGLGLIENWDSLPLGRPHLYPPVFHFIIAGLVALNIEPLTIIRAVSAVSTLALLSLSWLAISKLFGSRTGLLYILLAVSYMPFIKLLGVTIPASIVLLTSPFVLMLIKKEKRVAAWLLLTLLLYTHMVFPWFIIAALMIWAWFNRQYFKITFRVALLAIVAYLPWLIHVANNLEYLRYFGPNYDAIMQTVSSKSVNISILALCILSLILILRSWRNELADNDIAYFIALAAVSLPIAVFEFSRYFYSIGIWPIMIISAYGISRLSHLAPRWPEWARVVAISFFLVSTVSYFALTSVRGEIYPSRNYSPLLANVSTESRLKTADFHSNHLVSQPNRVLAENIRRSTRPNAIILNFGNRLDKEAYQPHRTYNITQLFAALSGRNMGDLRSPELFWTPKLAAAYADIILVNSNQIGTDGVIKGTTLNVNNGFTHFGSLRGPLQAYRNNNVQPLVMPDPMIVMPLWFGWIIIFVSLFYIVWAMRGTDSLSRAS